MFMNSTRYFALFSGPMGSMSGLQEADYPSGATSGSPSDHGKRNLLRFLVRRIFMGEIEVVFNQNREAIWAR